MPLPVSDIRVERRDVDDASATACNQPMEALAGAQHAGHVQIREPVPFGLIDQAVGLQ